MSEGKYLYFKDQFEILETELKKTLDDTYDFFKKYDEINPADSTIKIKNIMDKISELKKKEYELRGELNNQQFTSAEEATNELNGDNINITDNAKHNQILKDNTHMFNHHTSYGIIMVFSICAMAYLSQPKMIAN